MRCLSIADIAWRPRRWTAIARSHATLLQIGAHIVLLKSRIVFMFIDRSNLYSTKFCKDFIEFCSFRCVLAVAVVIIQSLYRYENRRYSTQKPILNHRPKVRVDRENLHYATSDHWKFFTTSWFALYFSRVCARAFCKFLPVLSGPQKKNTTL